MTSQGLTVAPWSPHYGGAIIARCVTGSVVISFFMIAPIYHWRSLFTSLPMLWIVDRYLFRPDGSSLAKGFGLAPRTIAWRQWVLVAFALTAVDQLGCLLIQMMTKWVGLTSYWEEGIDEAILFSSFPAALASAFDGMIWASLVEEIGFRGLLYVTLRVRLLPFPAALLSGLIFGMVHPYSMAGFIEVAWTGVILAIGYEKCRSLWPCIIAHFFNNLFYFSTLVIYR